MVSPCVQCGYCCTVRACSYGRWDEAKQQCEFLTEDTKCAKYGAIVASEAVEALKGFSYPMFGCGCSSTLFNDVREAKLKRIIGNR